MLLTTCLLLGALFPGFRARSANSAAKADRQPAVAGTFYPANKNELLSTLQSFFDQATQKKTEQPLAVIVPHAGYVFSGEVAASAFQQIDRKRKFKHIFLIGPSHTVYFNGASIYTSGDYLTPLGAVPVDQLARELVAKNKLITDDPKPHLKEHCLEVQLPFLQYWLKEPFSIVPIIIGGQSTATSKKLAEVLSPYFNKENLFVISSDFSHYPTYTTAVNADKQTADAIVSNSAENFLETKNKVERKYAPELVTAACGWMGIYTLLNITQNTDDVQIQKVMYQNSGDTSYGDHNRVVGYNAFCVTKKSETMQHQEFNLNQEEKHTLLKLARNTIEQYLQDGSKPVVDETTLTPNLLAHAGAFVTLREKKALRGCIGSFSPDKPLYQVIQSMAISAATRDYRFTPVSSDEVKKLHIEISVLTPMRKIKSIDEIELGKHGIYIKKGGHAGTFLPQVATDTGWSKEEFLGHCARDKAFIGWNGWRDAEIYIYEALVFEEEEH